MHRGTLPLAIAFAMLIITPAHAQAGSGSGFVFFLLLALIGIVVAFSVARAVHADTQKQLAAATDPNKIENIERTIAETQAKAALTAAQAALKRSQIEAERLEAEHQELKEIVEYHRKRRSDANGAGDKRTAQGDSG